MLTAAIETPVMIKKLKAAEPTIVAAPSSPGFSYLTRPVIASIQFRRISGALDPSAIKLKLATVGFQTFTVSVTGFRFSSSRVNVRFYEVITSIAL